MSAIALMGVDTAEKFELLTKKPYKKQAVWFLNAFWEDYFKTDESREKIKKLLKSKKVLCVGVGSGLSLAPLSDFFEVIHALDVTQENIDATKQHDLFASSKNIILEKLENFNFEFKDQSFDVIFVYQFLEFIPSRTLRLHLIRKLNDILRLNGKLIVQRGYGKIRNCSLKVAEYCDEITEPNQPYVVSEGDWSYLDSDVRNCINVRPDYPAGREETYGFTENHYTLTAPDNSFFEKWIVSCYVKSNRTANRAAFDLVKNRSLR